MPFKKIAVPAAVLLSFALVWSFWRANAGTPAVELRSSEKINLALRRTAHHLLAEAGDSTVRIPPVQQTGPGTWLVRFERPFDYDRLPVLLQASFDLHNIQETCDVAVLRCADSELQLGYNSQDYVQNNAVPCGGRDAEDGCYNLQVTFAAQPPQRPLFPPGMPGLLLLGGLLVAVVWARKRRRTVLRSDPETTAGEIPWQVFGHSRLDVANQLLLCGAARHELTYREAKLLHLFAGNPNQLLERGHILQQVWADEGVLVGRSVDVFVSRLRKLLRGDPSVRIVAVHGVGYRLEVGG
ncbi:MAG: response regulator transcription factor [Lewinellaceae bacterium]|nr:response regulator transcription factor [Lewinellaceae bacterium]